MLFKDFVAEIEEKSFFTKDDYVLAAVSGGADSVCLLHLLYRLRSEWNFRLGCAHVNHEIRSEANADACFVRSLCEKWNIPFYMHTENIKEKAKNEKISLELAGREVRYRFFKSLSADVIITAHTKNDVAESVLLHLSRGSGLDGLCGIPEKRSDGICRPLLKFSRKEIESYLIENKLSWCEDITNFDVKYTRNKIRHDILPHFVEINPSFLDAVERMTEILRAENEFLKHETEAYAAITQDKDVTYISVEKLNTMPLSLRRRTIKKTVHLFNDVNAVLSLLEKKNGSTHRLSDGKIAEKEFENIVIYLPQKLKTDPIKLPMRGEVIFGSYRIIVGDEGMALPKYEYTVRTRKNGDRFSPEGMAGHKKIGDYFTDIKVPRRLRDTFPIITYNGVVVSIGDLRRSSDFLPRNEDVLHIKIEKI